MFVLPEPVTLDIEEVEQRAKQMGKSNLQWNTWQAALILRDKFVDAGLDPVIQIDPMTQRLYVTSQQALDHKLN